MRRVTALASEYSDARSRRAAGGIDTTRRSTGRRAGMRSLMKSSWRMCGSFTRTTSRCSGRSRAAPPRACANRASSATRTRARADRAVKRTGGRDGLHAYTFQPDFRAVSSLILPPPLTDVKSTVKILYRNGVEARPSGSERPPNSERSAFTRGRPRAAFHHERLLLLPHAPSTPRLPAVEARARFAPGENQQPRTKGWTALDARSPGRAMRSRRRRRIAAAW